MRTTALVMLSTLMVATLGCKDPTEGKPKAEVSGAQPAPVSTTASAGAESLAIDAASSKIDWVGSKVTKSHNGSFKQFRGTIDLPGGKPEAGKVSVEIDT